MLVLTVEVDKMLLEVLLKVKEEFDVTMIIQNQLNWQLMKYKIDSLHKVQ